MRESFKEKTTFIIRRDVQAMVKFKRASPKEKKNDFHVAKQGEGREAIAEEEGMEEEKRGRGVEKCSP